MRSSLSSASESIVSASASNRFTPSISRSRPAGLGSSHRSSKRSSPSTVAQSGCVSRNQFQKRSARASTPDEATASVVMETLLLSAEEGELLALAFDLRVEPEHRCEVVETGLFAAPQPADVVGLEDMPVVLLDPVPKQRRAGKLQ